MKWFYLRTTMIVITAMIVLHFHLLLAKPNLLDFFNFETITQLTERYPRYLTLFIVLIIIYILLTVLPSFIDFKTSLKITPTIERRIYIGYGIMSIIWIITVLIIVIFYELRLVHIMLPWLHDIWMMLTVAILFTSIHLLTIRFTP